MQKSNSFHTIICLLVLFTFVMAHGQVTQEKIALKLVLAKLKTKHKVQFNYQSDLLNDIAVTPLKNNLSFDEKIKNLEFQTSLKFSKLSNKIFTIVKAIKICGYIKDEATNQYLEGATLITQNSNTITDKNGYFESIVSSHTKTISVRFIGFKTTILLLEEFNTNCKTFFLQEENEVIAPVIITNYLINGITKDEDGSILINFTNFSLLPGLIETDVLQTVQALPGIKSTDETVSNINIRGGSHDQNLILWDDIKMYQSGHFFGLISSFNPKITKTATIITNGTGASYTDGVSGTISMKTDDQIETIFNGNLSVNFLSTDAFFDIPVSEKSSLQLAGRKSINNWLQTPTYKAYFDRVTQLTEVENNEIDILNSNQNFDFYDTSIRWIYAPSKKDILKLNFILINNNLSFNENGSILGNIESKKSSLSQNSIAAGISYQRTWNTKFSTRLHIYETDYKLQAINANVIQNQRFLQENIVSETGIKASGLYNLNRWKFNVGYQLIESKVSNLNDIDNPRFVRLNSNVIREHAVFAQTNYKNKKNGFSARPGVRINYNEKFSRYLLEPRLSVTKKIAPNFQMEILGEFKHQNSTQVVNFQNDFLGIEKRRWQLANKTDIPILKSKQASLGLLYSKKGWLVDSKMYYKKVNGITTQSQGFTTKYEFEKATGSYNAFGLDFLCRKRIKNLSSWLSYSFIKNEYEFTTLPDTFFPSNFDNTHAVSLGSTYTSNLLNFSAGFNYRTGKPTSIPTEENEIANNTINFNTANSQRLKDYFRVDVSGMYKLKLATNLDAEIGASIWNLLDRKNTINNYYRAEGNTVVNKFSRYSLGITTNFIFRVAF